MSAPQSTPETDIPTGRQALRDNYSNLHNVADFCEQNYLKAEDKNRALKETMDLTSQSLASVAYQISSVAGNILRMLELQAIELRRQEENIYYISQKVDIHKEKVSRQEIGAITTRRSFQHNQKIITPTSQKQVDSYSRKPLNFAILDGVGHGMKVIYSLMDRLKECVLPQKASLNPMVNQLALSHTDNTEESSTQLSKTGTMSRKVSVKSSGQSPGSLGRTSRPPDPVQPPMVPDSRFSTPSSPMSPKSGDGIDCFSPRFADALFPPPPPPPMNYSPGPIVSQTFIPPPPPPASQSVLPSPSPEEGLLSPPPPQYEECDLRPPSPLDFTDFEVPPPPPPPADYRPGAPSWVPDTYLEKVVAVYAYTQNKEDEISFPEGTVIYVTSKDADGWYLGVVNGFTGYFPGNYVEPFC